MRARSFRRRCPLGCARIWRWQRATGSNRDAGAMCGAWARSSSLRRAEVATRLRDEGGRWADLLAALTNDRCGYDPFRRPGQRSSRRCTFARRWRCSLTASSSCSTSTNRRFPSRTTMPRSWRSRQHPRPPDRRKGTCGERRAIRGAARRCRRRPVGVVPGLVWRANGSMSGDALGSLSTRPDITDLVLYARSKSESKPAPIVDRANGRVIARAQDPCAFLRSGRAR